MISRSGRAETLLRESFRKYSLDSRDRRLATELVYGVIRNLITLDYSLSFYIKDPGKTPPDVLDILRLAAYQILYLDKIPPRAAVDEAVEQAKSLSDPVRGRPTGGFVNAVLRSMLREPEKVKFPGPDKPLDYLSLRLSYPKWLARRWTERFGIDGAKALMEAVNERPPLVIRANLPLVDRDSLAELFKKNGLETEPGKYAPDALIVRSHRPVPELPGYGEGLFSVQDEAAQIVSLLVAPKPGELILDACSAPGGKSAHLSSLSRGGARIVSMDISLDKLALLKENSLRLKTADIFPVAADAAGEMPFSQAEKNSPSPLKGEVEILEPSPSKGGGEAEGRVGAGGGFDRILLDAPCTALGIIRRRPEIKYARDSADIARMAGLQLLMLENVSGLLKPGGILVYSVCSMEPEEGEGVVESFLSRHAEFSLEDPRPLLPEPVDRPRGETHGLVMNNFIRTFPHMHGTDGFFMARMICR